MFSSRTQWDLAPNDLSLAIKRARKKGTLLLDLAAANPPEVGLAHPPSILEALTNPAAMRYVPDPRGLLTAREAVCAYYKSRAVSQTVDPERVILTTSTSEGYSFCFRLLCEPGDEVLIPLPSYPLFDFLAQIHDVKLVGYPLLYDHGWHVDAHSLAQACGTRTRAVIVVNPNNPTGSFLSPADLDALNTLCAQRNLALIADEVFLDYTFGAPRPSCAGNEGALTFTLSGISKVCGLPQMKASWIVTSGPEHIATEALERLEVIADTYLSMNAPVQYALPHWLALREEFQARMNARLRANLAELDEQLAASAAVRRLEVEGGWYAVLRVPALMPGEQLAVALVEKGVIIHPGRFFGFHDDAHLVVSLLAPEAEFAQGLALVLAQF